METINLINKKAGVIIDVRSYEDYSKGHILGSLNIILSDINNKIDMLETYKSKPIIIVSNSGESACKFALQLKNIGHMNIFVLKDGINAWKDDNLPLIRSQ